MSTAPFLYGNGTAGERVAGTSIQPVPDPRAYPRLGLALAADLRERLPDDCIVRRCPDGTVSIRRGQALWFLDCAGRLHRGAVLVVHGDGALDQLVEEVSRG